MDAVTQDFVNEVKRLVADAKGGLEELEALVASVESKLSQPAQNDQPETNTTPQVPAEQPTPPAEEPTTQPINVEPPADSAAGQ